MAHTLAHTYTQAETPRLWLSHGKASSAAAVVRWLSHSIQRLRAGVVHVAATSTQEQSAKQKATFWGFPWAWLALTWRKATP